MLACARWGGIRGPAEEDERALPSRLAELDLAPHLAAHPLLAPVGARDEPRGAPRGEQLALLTERRERARADARTRRRAACGLARRRGRGRSEASTASARPSARRRASRPTPAAQRGRTSLRARPSASPRGAARRGENRRPGSAARRTARSDSIAVEDGLARARPGAATPRRRAGGLGDEQRRARDAARLSLERCRCTSGVAASARGAATRRAGTPRRRAARAALRCARRSTPRSATRRGRGAAARRARAGADRSRSSGRAARASCGRSRRSPTPVASSSPSTTTPVTRPRLCDDARRALVEARLAAVGAHALDEEVDELLLAAGEAQRRRASTRRAGARRRTRGDRPSGSRSAPGRRRCAR